MKSAYELAMERFGGEETPSPISDAQKEQIADIASRYKAKEAEARLYADEQRKKATTVKELDQIQADLAVELASATQRCEKEKQKIRDR
jgi:hypothetical protein